MQCDYFLKVWEHYRRVMKNYYYMRFNIADAPEKIDCGSIVRMAKEVNEILGCEYERFGYHYDNPDNTNGSPCGKTFRKG